MARVLIVDDAPTVRMYHRQVIEALGVEVDEAENGVEALEKCLVRAFDLLLVDVNMPKMDGYRLVREVRAHPDLRAIPAVMISTEAAETDREQAFRAGANHYMVKPVRPEALRACVRVLLGGDGS